MRSTSRGAAIAEKPHPKHFMQYHNAEKMGRECDEITPEPLGIVTQKPVPDIRGDVVWILCGKGTPRKYGLCARFVATTITADPDEGTIVDLALLDVDKGIRAEVNKLHSALQAR